MANTTDQLLNRTSVAIAGVVASVCLVVAITGCNEQAGSSSSSSTGGAPTATPTPTPTGSATPIPGSAGSSMAVTATFPSTVYSVVHPVSSLPTGVASDWTKSCSIDLNSSTSNKDIYCYVEVPEGDLFLNDFTLNWSVPPATCAYVEENPYWFFQYQPGYGTTALSYQVNPDGSISNLNDPSNLSKIIKSDSGAESVTCKFDYRGTTPPGPNCCVGSYTATVTNVTVQNGVPTSSTQAVSSSWAGTFGACAAGPAIDNSEILKGPISKLPGTTYFTAGAGAVHSFAVKAPINHPGGNYVSTVSVANFLANAAAPPASFAIPLLGGGTAPTNVFYEWGCLDEGFEYLGRIQVMVHKWNQYSELKKGASGNPNTNGSESFPGGLQNNLNDLFGWPEFIAYPLVFPGTYL